MPVRPSSLRGGLVFVYQAPSMSLPCCCQAPRFARRVPKAHDDVQTKNLSGHPSIFFAGEAKIKRRRSNSASPAVFSWTTVTASFAEQQRNNKRSPSHFQYRCGACTSHITTLTFSIDFTMADPATLRLILQETMSLNADSRKAGEFHLLVRMSLCPSR